MFIAYNCDGCAVAPLTQYRYNDIYQELTKERTKSASDERLYTDMRRSKGYTDELEKLNRNVSNISLTVNLRAAATKNLRLRVTGYFQSEYFYTSSIKGKIMTFKSYSITRDNDIAV